MTYENPGAILKIVLADLIRGGCTVEAIGHDPAAITFRSREGDRRLLLVAPMDVRLRNLDCASVVEERYVSLRDAVRAACRLAASTRTAEVELSYSA